MEQFTHTLEFWFARGIEMPARLKVLSVGSRQLTNFVREALVDSESSTHSVAESFWDLCSQSLHEALEVSVAIIESPGSERELEERAKHIRRRWPHAGIILVADSSDSLDDPLYDERVPTEILPRDLLAAMQALITRKGRVRRMSPGRGMNGIIETNQKRRKQ